MNTDFYRIKRLPPYIFEEVNRLKAAARARGEDIIDFGMGNPDMATPDYIVDTLCETARDPPCARHLAGGISQQDRYGDAPFGAVAAGAGGELSVQSHRPGGGAGFLQRGYQVRQETRDLGAQRPGLCRYLFRRRTAALDP